MDDFFQTVHNFLLKLIEIMEQLSFSLRPLRLCVKPLSHAEDAEEFEWLSIFLTADSLFLDSIIQPDFRRRRNRAVFGVLRQRVSDLQRFVEPHLY